MDPDRLPAPAPVRIDYEGDVLPIFENACFRCHAGERPKSGYRLTDRESALQGGDLGVAIIPGDSANSPLIHYVARLVEDLEMPPAGRGEPLTDEQIALLRAWIDQQAPYPDTAGPQIPRVVKATAAVGGVAVSGNAARFREHNWTPDGFQGGVQEIEWQEPVGQDGRFQANVRSVFGGEDYELRLSYDHRDLGFVRGGYSQYRRWFDDTGGYYEPFKTAPIGLGQDLHLDVGRAWFEAGLARPDLPRVTVGYEYQFRDGERATLQWGPVTDPASGISRAIYPAAKQVDEEVHIVRVDLEHTVGGVLIEDQFRGEFSSLRSDRTNVDSYTLGNALPDFTTRYREDFQSFEGANILRLEKPIKDWLLVSAGYLYSNLDGEAGFSSESFIPGDPAQGPFVGATADQIVLRREAHVVNGNGQFAPWKDLTLSAGVQGDWSRQQGFGNSTLYGALTDLDANLDRFALSEHAGLRFTRIPFTVLHADLRLQQEDYAQYEQQAVNDDFGDANDFLRDTDASADLSDLRVGATVSPWANLSFDAGYRQRDTATDYGVTRDEDLSPDSGNGYPAFILARDVTGEEINARVVWRTARWLKTSVKFQDLRSTIETQTADVLDPIGQAVVPGGWLHSGEHNAQVYSLNALLTPWSRLLLNTTFSFSDAQTRTGLDTPSVSPFEGQIYTVLTSASYALDERTHFTATYSFSQGDYAQDNAAEGLPLGLNYHRHTLLAGLRRQFKPGLVVSLQYGFYFYDEPTLGGAADYAGHGAFLFLSKQLN